jgi:hypothetical protein
MKTYNATLTGLSGKDVLELIETLPARIRARFAPVEEAAVLVEKPKRKIINSETRLTMTGKKATEGSMREQVLHTLEKLEANLGVGSVTRAELKEACDKKGLDSQIFYQLVKDGYIKGL